MSNPRTLGHLTIRSTMSQTKTNCTIIMFLAIIKRQSQHVHYIFNSSSLACIVHKCDLRHIQRALITLRKKKPLSQLIFGRSLSAVYVPLFGYTCHHSVSCCQTAMAVCIISFLEALQAEYRYITSHTFTE